MVLKLKKLHPSARIPEYKSDGASGFDLEANFANEGEGKDSLEIPPGRVALVPTALSFDIPNGYEIQVRSRSGLALKNQIFVLNSPGTIDSDYTGEIKIILFNAGAEPFVVHTGDRIAQGVVAKVEKCSIQETDELKTTTRGAGGFGSTKLN